MQVANRHRAVADQVVAAQVHVGLLLAQRTVQADIAICDRMWLDGAHEPHQIPFKLANKWFGPYAVLEVFPGGATVRLDLICPMSWERRPTSSMCAS